ncbi:hypothetical protein ABW20_dc0100026 [Dactylellina cionopaga]|nr:hypothetical protein ABW20_dc0100026 [Dactylellina cionopaga]
MPFKKNYDEDELPDLDPGDKQPSEANMNAAFKKRGYFDTYRKEFLADFEKSEAAQKFLSDLREFIQKELERDPEFYDKDTTAKTASLLEGAVERSDVYLQIEQAVDAYLASHRGEMGSNIQSIYQEMFHELNGRNPFDLKLSGQIPSAGGKDEEGDVEMGGSDVAGGEKENEEQRQLTLSGLRVSSESISPVADDGISRTSATAKVH